MVVRKCDICGSVIHKTTPKYRVIFDGWLYTERKDICVSCFERIREEIKQADTPQTDRDAYWKELFEAVVKGEMSDAEANQAWYEYINKQDTPQTDCPHREYPCDMCDEQTDCQWK